jgi:hypothetical protein
LELKKVTWELNSISHSLIGQWQQASIVRGRQSKCSSYSDTNRIAQLKDLSPTKVGLSLKHPAFLSRKKGRGKKSGYAGFFRFTFFALGHNDLKKSEIK